MEVPKEIKKLLNYMIKNPQEILKKAANEPHYEFHCYLYADTDRFIKKDFLEFNKIVSKLYELQFISS